MAVILGVWRDWIRTRDDQFDFVLAIRDDGHCQSAGVVRSVFSVDDSHGAGTVIGNVLDGDHLNDDQFVFSCNCTIVFTVGSQ